MDGSLRLYKTVFFTYFEFKRLTLVWSTFSSQLTSEIFLYYKNRFQQLVFAIPPRKNERIRLE